MIVALAQSSDLERVTELAHAGGTDLDAAAELRRDWSRLWVARQHQHESAAGFLLAWNAADEVQLIDVVTDPALRRRGVATALISALLTHARESRARLVLLEVRRGNAAAIALYRRAGFHAVGTRARYYGDGEDAVLMQLELDPETGLVLPREDEIELS